MTRARNIAKAVANGTLVTDEPLKMPADVYPPGWCVRAELLELERDEPMPHRELVTRIMRAEGITDSKLAEKRIRDMVKARTLRQWGKRKAERRYAPTVGVGTRELNGADAT